MILYFDFVKCAYWDVACGDSCLFIEADKPF